ATSGSIKTAAILITLGKLIVFLVASLVIGILVIPKILSYIARFKRNEMLLVTVLGFCFGFSLLIIQLVYIIALDDFLIVAIMAESYEIKLIERLVKPLTDMFSAIFFVSIGLLVDPRVMIKYLIPIAIITFAVVIGKALMSSLGLFLAGRDGKT